MTRQRRVCGAVLLLAILCGCNRSPEALRDKYLTSGKQFLEKRDYKRAILEFKNAARAMPKDAEPYYEIALASEASGDIRTAVSAYLRAIELNPNHVQAKLRIAELKAQTDDPSLLKKARAELLELVKNSSATPQMLNTLALTELKLGDTGTAIQSLEEALVQAPGELTASFMLAKAKLSQNDTKGAEDVLKKACNDAPKSAEARILLGEFYINRRRMPEAEAQFRDALQIDAKSGLALMELARLQLTDGRKQEAEQSFRQLAAADGYKTVYAIFLLEQGRRDEAIHEFEKLAQENPDDRQIRTYLILAYRSQNRMADVNKILDAALKKNPNDSDALLQQGEIFIESGKYGDAEADLNKVRQLLPTAPEVHYVLAKLNQKRGAILTYRQELSQTLQLNPALLAVRLELAQDYVANKNGQAALELLSETPDFQKSAVPVQVQRNWALWALGDMPGMRKGIDQGLSQQRTPQLLIQDGLNKLRMGDALGARKVLEEALATNPSDLLALRALNQSYQALKDAPQAVAKVKEYAALQPKSPEVQEFLGELLSGSGDRAGARAAFAAAEKANPAFVPAVLAQVRLDVLEGKWDVALKRLQAIPNLDDPANTTPHLWLAVIEEVRGDNAKAVEDYRKVLQADPNQAQAANNLAYRLAQDSQRIDEALKYAQKAVELDPTRPSYADTLGWILYHKGLYSAAIPYLEKASTADRSAVGKYHLAMAYAKTGDKRDRAVLEAALKQNPKLPEAKSASEMVGLSH